jgi:fibronectin-binding autotransporter adhesin
MSNLDPLAYLGIDPRRYAQVLVMHRAPLGSDVVKSTTLWVNDLTNQSWISTSCTGGVQTWTLASPGASDVDTLTGDAGGAISPAGGNITLAGGTNIGSTGAVNTITFNLDPAITLATSVTSPIYTSAAGMAVNAPAGNNITFRMGDAAGANNIRFNDSAAAQQALLNSDGAFSAVNIDGIIGGITPAAGSFTTAVATTSVTSPIHTAAGGAVVHLTAAAGQDIHVPMGDNAGANAVSFQDVGNVEVARLNSDGGLTAVIGTFNGLLTGNASATINTAGAALALGTDNAAGAVNIGTGNVIRAVGIANAGGVAHTVSVGSATAGAITVDTAAGFSIDGANTSNITVTSAGLDLNLQGVGCAVNMTSTEAQNDAIVIEASAANGGVQIRAGTGGILIGQEADTSGIMIGNMAPTVSRNITLGSGTVITAAVTDTINIGPDGATTNANSLKVVNINTGGVAIGEVNTNIATGAVTSGTHHVGISTGARAAGTMAVDMLTGTGTKTMNVGNADALTTVNIDAITLINDSINAGTSINTGTSTGAVTIGNALAGAISIDSVNTVEINSAGAAIGIGNDANAFAVNVGTGAAARPITIGNGTTTTAVVVNTGTTASSFCANATDHTTTVGSVTGASSTVLRSGTAGLTLTGTIQEATMKYGTRSGDSITFTNSPIGQSAVNTGVAPLGTTGYINLLGFQEGIMMEEFILGAGGQTIILPRMEAAGSGLLVSLDVTDDEGVEYSFGAQRLASRHAYTIGTSPAFFFECRYRVTTAHAALPYSIGFRKVQAYQAITAMAAYTDFAMIGLNQGTAADVAIIDTQLNTGGIISTNTTNGWADGATHTVGVYVSAAGVVTFTFDGAAPVATQAFTFDNGDVVVPFIRIEHGGLNNASEVALISMKVGPQ